MPDLTNWVRCDGKIYCWDKTEKKVVEAKLTELRLEDIPREVLAAMLSTEDHGAGIIL
jgi:hypothetical protein